jgi:hypothetical protein
MCFWKMVTLDSVVRPSPDVVFQMIDQEAVLLDLKSSRYFGLEEIGSRIWTLLQSPQPLAAVIARMAQEYDVAEAQVRADTLRLVGELKRAGLVQVQQSEPR